MRRQGFYIQLIKEAGLAISAGGGVSVEKQSQAVSIWEGVLVDIFCTHCQRLYTDLGKPFPVP